MAVAPALSCWDHRTWWCAAGAAVILFRHLASSTAYPSPTPAAPADESCTITPMGTSDWTAGT